MGNNEKVNLTKEVYSRIEMIKKNKVYIIGFICFFIGFIVAPNGIDKSDYKKAIEESDKMETELKESKKLIKNLESQVNQAKVFLDLNTNDKEIIKTNIKELKIKKEEEAKQKAEELRKKQEEEEANRKAEENARVTGLFKDIYKVFADNVGSSLYEGVKQVVLSSGYRYSIMEPTYDDLGKITVYDNSSSDNVVLMFYPKNNNIEVLSLVQYNRNGKAVSVSNDFNTTSSKYSIYNGTNTPVHNIEEQKEFIFSS